MSFWQVILLVLFTNLVAFVLGATLAGLGVRNELADKFDELRTKERAINYRADLLRQPKQDTERVSDLSGKLH